MVTNQMICEFWILSSFLYFSLYFILSQNVFLNKVIFTGDISLYLNSKLMHNISKYYIMSSHNILRLKFRSKILKVILNPRKYGCKFEFVLINSDVRRWLIWKYTDISLRPKDETRLVRKAKRGVTLVTSYLKTWALSIQ